MKKLIKFLNGKKTVIGLLLTTLCGQDFFQNLIKNPDIVNALLWLGGLLATGGLIHKAVKNNQAKAADL